MYHGSVGAYVVGFVGSLVATGAAYYLVTHHAAGQHVVALVIILALVQLVVQMVSFLHVLRKGDFWKRVSLAFTCIILGIIVIGSLWIMRNLNGRMMPSQSDMIQYMHSQDDM